LDNPINIHPTSADLCKICSRKSRSQAVRYTSSWTSAIFVEPVGTVLSSLHHYRHNTAPALLSSSSSSVDTSKREPGLEAVL
jgi:hypothetical protein